MFVLSNDDGIDAPGLQALREAVGHPAILVAPKDHLSGCSHQVTVDRPIHVQKRSDTEYAVDGTPADCVRLALTHLSPEASWVLAGINHGGNLGADIYISGTLAAVREAAFLRVPAIAISHYRKMKMALDWARAGRMARRVLDELLPKPIAPGQYWNVNLPHLPPDSPEPGIVYCRPCTQPLPVRYEIEGEHYTYVRGLYSARECDSDSDVAVCFAGNIAITLLSLELPSADDSRCAPVR
jgi:5'-nucleotidase